MMNEYILFIRDAIKDTPYEMVVPTHDSYTIEIAYSLNNTMHKMCYIKLCEKEASLDLTSYYPVKDCAMGFFMSINLNDPKFDERLRDILSNIKDEVVKDPSYKKSGFDFHDYTKWQYPGFINTPVPYTYGTGVGGFTTTYPIWTGTSTGTNPYSVGGVISNTTTASILGNYSNAANTNITFTCTSDEDEDKDKTV